MFFNPIYEKLKMYYVTGGMPEPVFAWVKDKDILRVQTSLYNILNAYE